jgi:sedoheptulokinase
MYLGLDIGTTTVCGVVLDENGKLVSTVTEANTFASSDGAARMQDADGIFALCARIYREAYEKFHIRSIGVSGQMHGILYVDADGKAVSPLYSWQDERGNLSFENSTYAETLSLRSGHKMATGFGCTSVFYDFVNNVIPKNAVSFCTIGDYITMRLANRNQPLLNETNAESIGLYDLKNHRWDFQAISLVGLPFSLFPEVSVNVEGLGKTTDDVSVFTAIGDNQASVYGAERSPDTVIVNIGTGSQVSVITDEYHTPPVGCEIRPYFNGRYLILGCALCGGYSYQLLKDFFNTISEKEITYETMNNWAESALNAHLPTTYPLFRGTRTNPALRASICDLSENNFNAQTLTLSVLKGISKELKNFYDTIILITGKRAHLIGSGNAIRMNPVLRHIIETDYGMALNIPSHKEEAAFGAALLAAESFSNQSFKSFIRYI